MKHFVIAAAFVVAMITSANAGCDNNRDNEEIKNACRHGFETAALEICPGMTVGDPALRAKLDARYRTNPKMKEYFDEYYDLNVAQNANKRTNRVLMCVSAATAAKWIKWDEAAKDKLAADEKQYRAETTGSLSKSSTTSPGRN
jgi:hypothetical protein